MDSLSVQLRLHKTSSLQCCPEAGIQSLLIALVTLFFFFFHCEVLPYLAGSQHLTVPFGDNS